MGPTEAENGIALWTGSLFLGEPAGFLAGAGCQDPLSARSRTLGPGVRRVCLQGPGDRHATSSGGGAGSPSLQLPPVLALERACFSAPSWAAFSAGSAYLSSNSFVTSPVRSPAVDPKAATGGRTQTPSPTKLRLPEDLLWTKGSEQTVGRSQNLEERTGKGKLETASPRAHCGSPGPWCPCHEWLRGLHRAPNRGPVQ